MTEPSPHSRLVGVAGLVVFALLGVGAVAIAWHRDDPPAATQFTVPDTSGPLDRASADLSGYRSDGSTSLDDALTVATRSVDDMTSLDDPAFFETYGRTAHEQAEVVGRWLGVASRELEDDDLDRITAARASLAAAAPDEAGDNPGIADAESLRSTLQAAFAAAAG